MKLEYYTAKGVNTLNEDSVIINNELLIYGVADGVSSLVPFKSDENFTGGYIASNEVKAYFESIRTQEKLYNGLSKINQLIYEKMKDYQIDIKKKEQLWGTALALMKIKDTGIDYIQTGDCMCIAVYDKNDIRLLTRLQVDHLETTALKAWENNVQQGIQTRNELMKKVKHILVSNRHKSNSEYGYGVLNGEHNALDYVESGTINKIGLKHMVIITDGMLLPKEIVPEGENYWNFLIQNLINKGIERYADDLIKIEETDPECLVYPRFKKSDDKAGILISF